jgi:hypothetical protein
VYIFLKKKIIDRNICMSVNFFSHKINIFIYFYLYIFLFFSSSNLVVVI